MNWLIPSYYCNSKYISIKYSYCGIIVILNLNMKSNAGEMKLIDLDHSLHICSDRGRSVKENSFKNNLRNKGGSKLI